MKINYLLLFFVTFLLIPLSFSVMSSNLDLATLNQTYVTYNGTLYPNGTAINYLTLLLNYSYTKLEPSGSLYYNNVEGFPEIRVSDDVTLSINGGTYYGKAIEPIMNGDNVQYAGSQGDHFLFKNANATELEQFPELYMGVATQNFVLNEFGYVAFNTQVNDVYTYDWELNDILYLNWTDAKRLTNIPPTPPDRVITIAEVRQLQTGEAENGKIYVRPTIGINMDDISDVNNGCADGKILKKQSSTGTWECATDLTDDGDPYSLHLNQSTPQTVTNVGTLEFQGEQLTAPSEPTGTLTITFINDSSGYKIAEGNDLQYRIYPFKDNGVYRTFSSTYLETDVVYDAGYYYTSFDSYPYASYDGGYFYSGENYFDYYVYVQKNGVWSYYGDYGSFYDDGLTNNYQVEMSWYSSDVDLYAVYKYDYNSDTWTYTETTNTYTTDDGSWTSASTTQPEPYYYDIQVDWDSVSDADGYIVLIQNSYQNTYFEDLAGWEVATNQVIDYTDYSAVSIDSLSVVPSKLKAGQFISTAVTGTAPLNVSSTTLVNNLNCEYFNNLATTDVVKYTGNTADLNMGNYRVTSKDLYLTSSKTNHLTDPFIRITNPSSVGQNVYWNYINNRLLSVWRTDYLGGVSWGAGLGSASQNAYSGYHDFYTGGDYASGATSRKAMTLRSAYYSNGGESKNSYGSVGFLMSNGLDNPFTEFDVKHRLFFDDTKDSFLITSAVAGSRAVAESKMIGTLSVDGTAWVSDKIMFTQTDGNEAIDSLADGYMDYLATTGHRFNNNVAITGDLNQTSGNAYINNIYGSFAYYNETDGYVLSLSSPEVYANTTNWTERLTNGVTMTANKSFQVQYDGVYEIYFMIRYSDGANGQHGGGLFGNDVRLDDIDCYDAGQTSTVGSKTQISDTCQVRLNISQVITLQMDDHGSPTTSPTIYGQSLNFKRIGN